MSDDQHPTKTVVSAQRVKALERQVQSLRQLLASHEAAAAQQSQKLEAALAKSQAMEEEARRSEEWLRAVLESISDWVWEVNVEGTYTYASPRVRDVLGYEPDELLGKTPFDTMPRDEADRLGKWFAEVVAAKEPIRGLENRCLHRDGHEVVLETNAVPFFAVDGTLLGYRGADRDISKRKHAEDALRKSEEKFRILIEHIPQRIFHKDRDSVYVSCNESYARDLGISAAEIAGKTDYDFHPRELADKYRADDREVMTTGQNKEIEEAYVEHGVPHTILTSKAPFRDPNGDVVGVLGVFTDITERRQAQDTLRELTAQLQAVYDGIGDGLLVARAADGRILRVNSTACSMFGYSESELLAKSATDLHPVERRAARVEWFAQPESGARSVVDQPCQRRDGSVFYADIRSEPTVYEGEACLVGIFRDTTERKRAEEALQRTLGELRSAEEAARHSEEWLRSVVETISDWVWEFNRDGVYTYASPRVRDLLGYEPEEVVGRRPFDLMPPEQARRLAADHPAIIASRQPFGPREAVLIHRDGHPVTIEVVGSPFFASDGTVLGYRGVDRDITERKRTEAALREVSDQLQAVYDGIADGLMVARIDTGVIVRANSAACAMFGYAESELVGKRIVDLHPPATGPEAESEFRAQAARERTGTSGLPCIRKDGSIFTADIATQPTVYGGRQCLVGVFRDITQRRQAEEKLRRYAADLRRANDEVRQFAYIVSHDLRAPLVNLKGFTAELRSSCETMKANLAEILPHLGNENRRQVEAIIHQEVPEALHFIDASVTRMDTFINSLLVLSRLGRRELVFEDVDLRDVVEGVLAALGHQLEDHKARVAVGWLPHVMADRTAMEQILGNILTNAVNYLEPDRPGEIEIRGEETDGEARVSVRDNGRGIAEQDMPKIFAPFRRAGRQDVRGEGMGLAYAQTLAHRHGGQILCESQLGEGTTFTVVLSNHHVEGEAIDAPVETNMHPGSVHTAG